MAPTQAERTWRLQLFGDLKLTEPSGSVANIPLKAIALLAILHLSQPYGESRATLGEILWPGFTREKQLGSVRNALLTVRRVMGSDTVLANNTHVWLSGEVAIGSDLQSDTRQAFMPGFSGTWFEAVRREFETDARITNDVAEAKSGESIGRSFLNLLRWYAQQNPKQMLEMMKASIDLTTDLSPAEIRSLLKTARPNMDDRTLTSGWVKFWHGWLLEHEFVGKGEAFLEDSLAEALLRQDFVLAAESLLYLFASGSLRQRPDKIDALNEQLDRSPQRAALSSAIKVAHANYLTHQGNHSGAVTTLIDVLSCLDEVDVRRRHVEALLGYYEACQGRIEEAEFFLARSRSRAQVLGNFRLSLICGLGDAHVLAATGRTEEAVALFTRVVDEATLARSHHIAIYASEGLAASYHQLNEIAQSDIASEAARQLRAKLGMPYTAWDKQRIKRMMRKTGEAS